MKVSLITVTYNSAKTLKDTLESVLRQAYDNYEYFVIDGGSSDETVDIIKEYEPLFEGRMRWISEPDGGMYDGINKGIRMSTGDVVGIINSDDFYHRTDIFTIIANAFKESDIQAIYGDVRFVNPDNLQKTVRYYDSSSFKPYKFRWGWMPAHPSFFTYRENFEKYGYYKVDYKIAADYELLVRFLYVNKLDYKYLPVDFLMMRTGGKSTSGLKSTIVLNKEIVRACRENGLWTALPLLYFKYFIKIKELFVKR